MISTTLTAATETTSPFRLSYVRWFFQIHLLQLLLLLLLMLMFPQAKCLRIASRSAWGALAPKSSSRHLPDRLRYVIVHHSYIPNACYTERECHQRLRAIQHQHMIDNGWDDIGYNFAVGGDGCIYEGRGFGVQGAHALAYNNDSIGIVLIGDWSDLLPTSAMVRRTHDLIAYSIGEGYIRSDYELYGHRQVRDGTQCPGNALFERIQGWPHWLEKS